ncbi:hypothetical protein C8F04DRAFT_928205, partial [Mycena alexandri]
VAIGKTLVATTAALVKLVTKKGGVDEWGATHNSVFGAAKDQVCHLTRRWVRETGPSLVINGAIVRPSSEVKLVGVWLDERLDFKAHGAAMIAKGHQWLVNFRRLAKVSGRVGATYIRGLYLGICLPGMLYGAEVALVPTAQRERGLNRKRDGRAVVKRLTSIQLKAGRLIVGGMVSSPGDLVNAHADLLPMHLLIDKLLHKAALRYATLPPTHPLHAAVKNVERYGHVKCHPSPLHFLMAAYKDVRQNLVEEIPGVRAKATWEAPVDVRVAASKEEAKEWAMAETSKVQLFSDGSLIDGQVGAAGLLMIDGVVKRAKGVRLGSAARYGVYEAEGVGLSLALECL